ncbi:helix-turn-helix domain-containing protein [Clostridium sp. MCC353]|uniref:helix-turn-helix domain-containing protein n=1 Tax=Clostridium sp. MCC353 TaxID=2592646 RepID=UPI001C03181F|nr:helix-turn-helix domain-containing protein [Clostridium sp. MCC353]MBT9780120.1 helix-turn-helix domain-containing protein [Clostridium sp. MCC353]
MEAVIYYAETEGIALERMIRKGRFNMHVKHFHNQYEIFYLLEGERRFFFDNRAYLVKGGTLILVDENAIHMTMANSDQEFGHDRIILYVDRDKMKEYDQMFSNLNLVKFLHQNYGVFPLNEKQQQDFIDLYLKLQNEFDNKNRNYKAMIDMEIIMYFIQFMRENHTPALQDQDQVSSSKYKTIYAVADYISENFDKQLSLDTLAGRFFISKYYLSRTFKEITGYGINEYINIHRIQRAKRLLEETDMSISEISIALGYESMTYFEKIFKTYMTLSPLKYRKTLNTVTYTNYLPG